LKSAYLGNFPMANVLGNLHGHRTLHGEQLIHFFTTSKCWIGGIKWGKSEGK